MDRVSRMVMASYVDYLLTKVKETQFEERRRYSRELHDRLAHQMTVVTQSLDLYGALKESDAERAERRLALAQESARESLDLMHEFAKELRLSETSDGLRIALENLMRISVPEGVDYEVSLEGQEKHLPDYVRDQLYMVLREGVRNAVAHSGSERIEVEVGITPRHVDGPRPRPRNRFRRRGRYHRRPGFELDEGARLVARGLLRVGPRAGRRREGGGQPAPDAGEGPIDARPDRSSHKGAPRRRPRPGAPGHGGDALHRRGDRGGRGRPRTEGRPWTSPASTRPDVVDPRRGDAGDERAGGPAEASRPQAPAEGHHRHRLRRRVPRARAPRARGERLPLQELLHGGI